MSVGQGPGQRQCQDLTYHQLFRLEGVACRGGHW